MVHNRFFFLIISVFHFWCKVSLLADYSVCRIYWKTSLSSERDSEIQQNLDKCAPRIRYLLTSQQILGSVPPLVFVLDKQYAALKEVEDLLKMADFGPADDSEKLNEKDDETSVHMAESKRVVFGVDRDALYKQIEDYKQRSKDSSSQISCSASLTQEQLQMLAEIRKQKLIEKKKRKAKKMKDDDITPKEFLLMRQVQKDQDEQ
ncbi:putative ribosome-binding factor A, mitochondrial [Tachysurus ichikawai]